MHIIYGDLFDYLGKYPICIPTNGYVKKNGEGVMGAGVAKQAKELISELPRALGHAILTNGHCTQIIYSDPIVISFPTKPAYFKKGNDFLPGWYADADINLIENSARELESIATNMNFSVVMMPWPGTGLGHLSKEVVWPAINQILDCRFIIVEPHG